MNIVEFVEARLTDEEHAAAAMADMQKHLRIVDALRAMCVSVVNQLEVHNLDPTDNPLAAGLMIPANVWCDHPDFAPVEWFPRMVGLQSFAALHERKAER